MFYSLLPEEATNTEEKEKPYFQLNVHLKLTRSSQFIVTLSYFTDTD